MTLGTAGADWAGLMIFIIMIFSIMIFVIMLRWLAPPTTTAAAETTHCSGGRHLLPQEPRHSWADWAGLKIFIIMIFSSMIFVIMLRWRPPPAAAAAAATHCSGGRRLLPHDPRHSRGRLGWIEDLHHHDLQHHDRRHHDAVADGDMLRWPQSASSLDLNCSYCAAASLGRPLRGSAVSSLVLHRSPFACASGYAFGCASGCASVYRHLVAVDVTAAPSTP